MLIKPEDINKVLELSGNAVSTRGKKYFEKSKVKVAKLDMEDDENYTSKSYVEGTYIYDVNVSKKDNHISYSCNCPAYASSKPCKHIVAAIFNMYVNEDEYLFGNKNKKGTIDEAKLYNGYSNKITQINTKSKIISYYENLEMPSKIESKNVNLIPILEFDDLHNNFNVFFSIGQDRMYKLKNLQEFYENMRKKEIYKYGAKLEFKHEIQNFNPSSRDLVKFIIKRFGEYEEYVKMGSYYFTIASAYKSFMKLDFGILDDFFDIYKSKKILMKMYGKDDVLLELVEENPEIKFDVQNSKSGIFVSLYDDDCYLIEGQEYIYVLNKDKLYRCTEDFRKNVYPMLKEFSKKNLNTIRVTENDCTSFCEYVIPRLSKCCKVDVPDNVIEKYKSEELTVKAYLDLDQNQDIVCDIKYCYLENEFNPFNEKEILNVRCNRNALKEKKASYIFRECKFEIDTKKHNLYISNENSIYDFLTRGLDVFNENFDVYVTDNLKKRKVIAPKSFSIGVKVNNGLLDIDMSNLSFSEKELKSVLKSYKLKKKYHRLKDGTFVNLESNGFESLENIIDSLNISVDDIKNKEVQVPKYRALYLDKLANSGKISINKDKKFDDIILGIANSKDEKFQIPCNFKGNLRDYQKVGFNWLKVLDKYNFGGILADEMGLGKTIQLIAMFLDAKNTSKNRETSIVVCPSSLYLNWENEINKFAPDLDVVVINGQARERKEKIQKINNYDVAITSYDMLKRDIEEYTKYNFRYVVADEAQYIKNNNTQNAKALKKLNGITKFALTGTPIENSLAELWSIFDFCMPGYLYSYSKFKENYESPIIKDSNQSVMEKLRMQVMPFILRRVKKEVLKELPEKTETVLYSDMETEQRKVYESYLLKAKEDMEELSETSGFEKNKIKILALITKLRQICCHPSLFVSNYDGESAKLNQCLEVVNDAISSGHKVLLFSQFTSMLDIIKKELDKRKIEYMELTGKTKADDRIDMVNKFNIENNVNLFLISLKAGGTGLNLVGADVVIHFDPWWNLSVQNQATDRAHRIGQKKNVQVFKLIAKDTIEEKIEKLQEKKMNIANKIVKEGESFINKMSKEDIMKLFE